MNLPKRIYVLSLALMILSSCNEKQSNVSESTQISQDHAPQLTQALLMTQPFAYDATHSDKITDAYVDTTQLTLPDDYVVQSRWMMFEGPVLENDLVAFRYYADSRHRFDIFGKTVSDLVMDTVSWDYHTMMDWGSDILKVGNSLGLGSPAIYYQDSVYTLSNFTKKEIAITSSGGHHSSIRTTFTGLTIAGHQFDLIQDWSIQAGSPSSTIALTVVNGRLPEGMTFATGIVKHLPELITKTSNSNFYAMNWGKQSFHGENMGMAIVTDQHYSPKIVEDDLNHLITFDSSDSTLMYSLVSVWEKDLNNVTTKEGFINLVTSIKHSNK